MDKPLRDKFYFKKTMSGMVLMVLDRKTGESPGSYEWVYRKGTEREAQMLFSKLIEDSKTLKLLETIKENHPHLLL